MRVVVLLLTEQVDDVDLPRRVVTLDCLALHGEPVRGRHRDLGVGVPRLERGAIWSQQEGIVLPLRVKRVEAIGAGPLQPSPRLGRLKILRVLHRPAVVSLGHSDEVGGRRWRTTAGSSRQCFS